MKYSIIILIFINVETFAVTLNFKTDDRLDTTGEGIEGVHNVPFTTNVAEVIGLKITARSDNQDHEINADSSGMGINNELIGDDQPARFEVSEKMVLSFDKDIEIKTLDLRFFDTNDLFVVEAGASLLEITYDLLSHKTHDLIHTNIFISSHTDIQFQLTAGDNVALEALELIVIDSSASLSIAASNQWVYVEADVVGYDEYELEGANSLLSKNWHSIDIFTTSTNWIFQRIDPTYFYRLNP